MKSLTKKFILILLLNVIFQGALMAQSTEVIYRVTSTKRDFDSSNVFYLRLLYNDSLSFCHHLPRTDTFSLTVDEILYGLGGKAVTIYNSNIPGYRLYANGRFSRKTIISLMASPIEFKYKIISNSTKKLLSRNTVEFMVAGKDRIIGSIYCDTATKVPFGPEIFNGTNGLVLYAIDKKRKRKFEAISIRTIKEDLFMPDADVPVYTFESFDRALKHLWKHGKIKLQEATDMLEPFALPNKK
jgi:hypothetical protein